MQSQAMCESETGGVYFDHGMEELVPTQAGMDLRSVCVV